MPASSFITISIYRETATVALWGPHASQFPAEALHQQAQRGHVIVILFLGLTVRIHQGGAPILFFYWFMHVAINFNVS